MLEQVIPGRLGDLDQIHTCRLDVCVGSRDHDQEEASPFCGRQRLDHVSREAFLAVIDCVDVLDRSHGAHQRLWTSTLLRHCQYERSRVRINEIFRAHPRTCILQHTHASPASRGACSKAQRPLFGIHCELLGLLPLDNRLQHLKLPGMEISKSPVGLRHQQGGHQPGKLIWFGRQQGRLRSGRLIANVDRLCPWFARSAVEPKLVQVIGGCAARSAREEHGPRKK
mmetsp:Transcript_45531/g.114718  ORF Transcript_45531/g.114718 Transcript_45531/m.114718 type:complete len:226 (-) Transcript_45531:103-780(-)